MSQAKALVDAGRLTEAVAEATTAVRNRPADQSLRALLFELLCFQGDFERAGKQLDVLATQAAEAGQNLAVQAYRGLLAAEVRRVDVFHGAALPKFIVPPAGHVEQFAVLVKKIDSAPDEAVTLLEAAEDHSPAIAGERAGQPFSSFRDADDRVSGVLEAFHGTEYLWVPFDQILSLEIKPPRRLRDMMWAQARVELANQEGGEILIPALYVDTPRHSNELVRLGRQTEWTSVRDRMVTGAGQRMFLINGEEVAMLDLGRVTFTASAS